MFGLNKKKKLLKNGSTVDVPAPKPPRALEEIQKEYAQICTQAGDKQYRIDVLKAELKQMNQHLFTLNQEANKAQELAAKETAEKEQESKPVEATDAVAPV